MKVKGKNTFHLIVYNPNLQLSNIQSYIWTHIYNVFQVPKRLGVNLLVRLSLKEVNIFIFTNFVKKPSRISKCNF